MMRYERRNFNGSGFRRVAVYDLPAIGEFYRMWTKDGSDSRSTQRDYWQSVTGVPCPINSCTGFVRWAENGYVPGYRICDTCGRHFQADGTAEAPLLVRVNDRKGGGLSRELFRAAKTLREHLAAYGGRLLRRGSLIARVNLYRSEQRADSGIRFSIR